MKPTKETFLNDVKNHRIEILHDSGIYRHIRFKQPSHSEMYFDLITAPDLLLYRGDMGCYEFERSPDMFNFFRQPELKVNLGYWAEKLKVGEANEFSSESFSEQVWESVNEFIADGEISADDIDYFKGEIENLICMGSDNGYLAHTAIRDFSFETKKVNGAYVTCQDVFGSDTWEWDFDDFTYRFIWCCYAIVWGISEYDRRKS